MRSKRLSSLSIDRSRRGRLSSYRRIVSECRRNLEVVREGYLENRRAVKCARILGEATVEDELELLRAGQAYRYFAACLKRAEAMHEAALARELTEEEDD